MKLHGTLPEGMVDHGVFVEPEGVAATPTPEAAEAQVTRLAAAKTTVDERLALLLERVKTGSTDPVEISGLSALAEESARLANELATAQREMKEEEATQARSDHAAHSQRFKEVVAEARVQRETFAMLFKECCLTLGTICALATEGARLSNQLVHPLLGLLPEQRAGVQEISTHPNPLPALLDSGLKPDIGFGHNVKVVIVPLHPFGGKK